MSKVDVIAAVGFIIICVLIFNATDNKQQLCSEVVATETFYTIEDKTTGELSEATYEHTAVIQCE